MDKLLYIIKYLLTNEYPDKNRLDHFFTKEDPVTKIYLSLRERKPPLSVDDLEILFHSSYPYLRDKEQEVYSYLFDKLRKIEVKTELIEEYIQSYQRFILSNELASAAIDYGHGRIGVEKIQEVASQVLSIKEGMPLGTLRIVSDDLEVLGEGDILAPGLKWRLGPLNQSLGPLRKGDMGFVFARPETGKTTFLADQVAFMAEQIPEDGGPVLWWNNEEQSEKVMLRIYQAVFGVTLDTLWKHRAFYAQEYKKKIKGKIMVIDEHIITKPVVEQTMEQYKPSLVIFDQIDKVEGFEGERRDIMLGGIYQWARKLAKEHCPIIGICQSDGSGENVMWLTMGNVADAKTSKQAEADWILGIGAIHSPGQEFARYLNVSKNKLLGGEECKEELRHLQATVRIRPEIARYEEW